MLYAGLDTSSARSLSYVGIKAYNEIQGERTSKNKTEGSIRFAPDE